MFNLHFVSFASLVLAIFCQCTSTVQVQEPDIRNDVYDKYICPNAEDIFPCECTEEDGLFHKVLDLYCEELADEQQLYDIFHSNLPVPTFRELTFDTRNIVSLGDDVFGNATFESVTSLYNGYNGSSLSSVSPKTFIKSATTLESLILYGNQLREFPYKTLSSYTKLYYFGISENPLSSFPVIENKNLTILFTGAAFYDVIPEGALDGLPKLQQFSSQITAVTTIPTGLFASNSQLWIIDMPYCQLEHLEGLQSGAIDLQNNELTTLPEATWKPLADAGVEYVNLKGNPLTCGCDVAWAVLEPDYLEYLMFATCQNGTSLYDLDPSYFENNC